MIKSKQREALALEAELLRLNDLVRARRAQLARLEKCPNKDCECRAVWRESVENNLSRQMGKIRREVRAKVDDDSKPNPLRRGSQDGKNRGSKPIQKPRLEKAKP
jgi:hypothetical protein